MAPLGGAGGAPGAPGGRLLVLSGPSGVGKSSVIEELRRRFPSAWVSVSATTRPPRPGETDGVDYHFLDRVAFARMIDAGELLEHAEYAGHWYGTPRRPVEERLRDGWPALLEIDLQGARQVRERLPEARLVFLVPPSWDELMRRLTGRGTEDETVLQRRLETARRELAAGREFDHLIVNSSVSEAAKQLLALLRSTAP